jgi:CBS domain-containing protein
MRRAEVGSRAAPLISIDAVALDLETTGLDPKAARIVEIGAVAIVGGRIEESQALSLLVDPGRPIPASATAIHGIDDQRVKGRPPVGEALEMLEDFVAGRLVVGHAVGFDLAILKAEAARAGGARGAQKNIDYKRVGEIARPSLPDFSLEVVAGWLGIAVEGRHSALGDALLAARILVKLVPHLRNRGVRTVAEADAACRRLAEAAGFNIGNKGPILAHSGVDIERLFARIDPFPYRHRVSEVMTAPPRLADATATLRQAAQLMARERVSSLFLADEGEGAGIVTERDVLRATAAHGAAALEEPVASLASRPLRTIAAEAFVYRAIGLMDRLKVRHLGVVDEAGRLVGAVSARDLLRLRAGEALMLGDRLDAAETVPDLAAAWAHLPEVAAGLLAEEVDARQIAAIISSELGAATRRAAVLAEARLAAEGLGPPPQPYAVLVLGSGGRGESLLAMDQDNAIVFAEGEPDGPADRFFARLGALTADSLDEVGVPLCKGGVMARNAAWRGSLATWRQRVAGWVEQARPRDLLNVDIFFDLTAVHGDRRLADILLTEAQARASAAPAFAKLLADANSGYESAVGWLGRLRTDNGRVDLKRSGLFPIVSAARILAIRHAIASRATPERLAALQAREVGGGADLARLDAAHSLFVRRILEQQVRDIAEGIQPSNCVAVGRLSRREQAELRDALAAVDHLDALVRDLLF